VNLVGGNPFYILSLFDTESHYKDIKNKEKSFRTPDELKEVFEFEASHEKGLIYTFWEEHFQNNAEKLNQDSKNKPGLTLKMLYYITRNRNRVLHYSELEKKFQLETAEVKEKVWQLIHADLATKGGDFQEVQGLQDEVLFLVLTRMHYSAILDKPSKQAAEKIFSQEMDQHIRTIVKEETQPMEKAIRSLRGHVNVLQGRDLEEQVREALLKGRLDIGSYRIIGDINDINIHIPKGRTCQIDLMARLVEKGKKKTGKRKKVALAVEVKNWKRRIYIGEARTFLKAVQKLKELNKFTHIVMMYISRSGFSEPAAELLTRHKVRLATLEDIEKFLTKVSK
jgi:hypothetical protein